MSFKEEFIFWTLANFFIAEQDYRIIQLFEDQTELWLEKLENKKAPIIRILLHRIDWSNRMQRDIEFTAANGEKIRKQLGRSELKVMNIYVSPYPPVDDDPFHLNDLFVFPEGNKTTVSTFLMAEGTYETSFKRLTEQFDRNITFQIEEDYSQLDIESLKENSLNYAKNRAKDEQAVFTNRPPVFTYMFIFIQVAMFFWLQLHGGSTNTSTLIKYGAKVNPLIYEGEWWRFITPVFLHIGFLHLAMNTLALYYLGIAVEKIYGNIRFLFTYLFAGVTGFIASFLFSTNLSAGASGAIFGCFGALLYFGATNPKLFARTMGRNVLIVLIINLIFGFSSTGIDNAGHIGGLIGGFLASGIVHFPKKKKPLLQTLFLLISTAVVWGSLSYGFCESVRAKDEGSSLILAQDYITNHQYDKAYSILEGTLKKSKNPSPQLYFQLSYIEMKKDLLSEAKPHLLKAIELKPNFDEAFYNLALIYLQENDLQAARKYAEEAAKLKPDQKQYTNLVNEITVHIQSAGGGV
ncbi:rhomboid family intramembrane serine protease [Bacillus sp. EB600]|uniref:rhomboid family intramembrane serine protease n=1 Tax=Bacillus sp. EB600 TaxID=2806345 RepID=UPI00210CFCC5|nr:rhomboid family intramembrane serine protease [Bacillus sp. EB600]MCQ6278098.1 rhomboid family intramembrane serine protease [Bacillus sp. EB600]